MHVGNLGLLESSSTNHHSRVSIDSTIVDHHSLNWHSLFRRCSGHRRVFPRNLASKACFRFTDMNYDLNSALEGLHMGRL